MSMPYRPDNSYDSIIQAKVEACEDHSNYGEQEEQDFGQFIPEPCSIAYGGGC